MKTVNLPVFKTTCPRCGKEDTTEIPLFSNKPYHGAFVTCDGCGNILGEFTFE